MSRRPRGRLRQARNRFETTEVEVRGWKVSSRRSTPVPDRAGPHVVLVPGLALSGRYLLPVASELATRLPVWVPDLPGFGRSDGPALAVADLGDWLVEWMDVVGLAQAALVGNSMGCQTAVEAAARHADRIVAVVLQAPTMDAAARTVRAHVPRMAVAGLQEPPSLGPLQVRDWVSTGPRRLAASVRHAFAHAIEEGAREVTCPALVVRGSRDPIVPQRWAEQVAAALPRGRLCVVPGATHTMTYRDPLPLARIAEAFLRRDGSAPDDVSRPTGARR